MEAPPAASSPLEPVTRAKSQLGPSRAVVRRLAGLFAVDAAGGGLVTTGFLSYYLTERYHAPVVALGWLFFAVSVVQAVSVALAPLLARRFGLVATMVGTHLPSNLLLAAVAFAPTFPAAAVLLLARTTLSQMDVPTRQALVMTMVTPPERSAAAAVTNAVGLPHHQQRLARRRPSGSHARRRRAARVGLARPRAAHDAHRRAHAAGTRTRAAGHLVGPQPPPGADAGVVPAASSGEPP